MEETPFNFLLQSMIFENSQAVMDKYLMDIDSSNKIVIRPFHVLHIPTKRTICYNELPEFISVNSFQVHIGIVYDIASLSQQFLFMFYAERRFSFEYFSYFPGLPVIAPNWLRVSLQYLNPCSSNVHKFKYFTIVLNVNLDDPIRDLTS